MDVKFKTMWKDEITAEVTIVNDEVIDVQIFETSPFKTILGPPPYDMEYIDGLIGFRCFERENAAADFFLKEMGLEYYNPWDIIRKTHAYMLDDLCWILFDGESLCWEDILYDNVYKYS